jgi:hypothetical protein
MSRNIIFGLTYDLWDLGNLSSILNNVRDFSVCNCASSPTGFGAHSSFYPMGTGGVFPGSKGTGSITLIVHFSLVSQLRMREVILPFLQILSKFVLEERKRQSYHCIRPWRPIGLWDVEASTFYRQSVHRWRWGCQPYMPALLYP